MDISKLFRKPWTDKKWDEPGEVSFVHSPDNKFKVAFSHFLEIRMGWYRGLFNLLDKNDNVIDSFEPLTTDGRNCCWNEDSNIFVLTTDDFTPGYLLVKLPDLSISFIKMFPTPSLDIVFKKDALIVSYNDYQLSLQNSIATFGGGPLEIPAKIFLKPKGIEIPVDLLTFFPRKELGNLELLTKAGPDYRIDPIDGGFREFKGVLPQSTDQIYNTRQLEVYQLEAFAEYGDDQSIEWLNDIKGMTKNDYNKWKKVTEYIGIQKRGLRKRKY